VPAYAHAREVVVGGGVGGYHFSLGCVGRGSDDQVVGSARPALAADGNEQLGVGGSNCGVVVDYRNGGADLVDELLAA
jgi:hypothetical protein